MSKVHLSMEQQFAVDLCTDMSRPIVGITGGAGVGKTLVLGIAYEESKSQAPTVLCAPTGRAAKRISELTGKKAVTVHRLLEFPQPDMVFGDDGPEPVPGEPRRTHNFPIKEKVVFVDESSMLSPTLYAQLLDALPPGGVIRFFGDNNQLPPVESGRPPFMDVLQDYPSVTLTYNYRSDDAIVSNSLRILEGRIPQPNDRFHIMYADDPIKYMLDFVKKETAFTADSHQIIIPSRKGGAGTQRVNPSLQARFNPGGEYMLLDRYNEKEAKLSIRGGDKFLWIKNDYQLKMYNGELGKVVAIDNNSGDLLLATQEGEILVPPRIKVYDPYRGHMMNYDPRKQIELGYAITTHKAQGSEFDYVIYVMCQAHAYLVNRQNLYTGITRAKKMVFIITDRRAMGLSMKRARTI